MQAELATGLKTAVVQTETRWHRCSPNWFQLPAMIRTPASAG